MPPKNSGLISGAAIRTLTIRRLAPSRSTWRARARRSRRRLRITALPIVQCSVAAGIAWWVALDLLDHPRPFFAPIAAVVSLGVSMGARLRRSVELVAGVTVGIGVGDLLINFIGTGPWQIALVVALAMAAAVTLDGGAIITMQAASSACLVATLLPPGGGAGIDRMVDALIGGLVGVAVLAIAPTHPVRRARREAAEILGVLAEALRLTADGLTEQRAAPIRSALARVRGTQGQIDSLRANLEGGREISRISPLYWGARERLEKLAATADPLDNAVRNARVLIRRALTVVNDDEILDPRLVDEVEKLASRSRRAARDDAHRPRQETRRRRGRAGAAVGGDRGPPGTRRERRPLGSRRVRSVAVHRRRPAAGHGDLADLGTGTAAADRIEPGRGSRRLSSVPGGLISGSSAPPVRRAATGRRAAGRRRP